MVVDTSMGSQIATALLDEGCVRPDDFDDVERARRVLRQMEERGWVEESSSGCYVVGSSMRDLAQLFGGD